MKRIYIDVKTRIIKQTAIFGWSDKPEPPKWLEDELLFEIAMKGRVPVREVVIDVRENIKILRFDIACYVENYYVGRAKAMKAYKTKNYKQYYLSSNLK